MPELAWTGPRPSQYLLHWCPYCLVLALSRKRLDREVSTVFASLSSSARQTDVEDTGAVTVVLDHGAVGTFFFSDAAPSPWSYEFTTQENAKYPALPGSDPKDCYHFFGAQRSLAFPSLRRFQYGQEVREPGWDAPLSVEDSACVRVWLCRGGRAGPPPGGTCRIGVGGALPFPSGGCGHGVPLLR